MKSASLTTHFAYNLPTRSYTDCNLLMSLSQELIVALVGLIITLPSAYLALRLCLRWPQQQPTDDGHDLEGGFLPAFLQTAVNTIVLLITCLVQIRGRRLSRGTSSAPTLTVPTSLLFLDGTQYVPADPPKSRSLSIQQHEEIQECQACPKRQF